MWERAIRLRQQDNNKFPQWTKLHDGGVEKGKEADVQRLDYLTVRAAPPASPAPARPLHAGSYMPTHEKQHEEVVAIGSKDLHGSYFASALFMPKLASSPSMFSSSQIET